uniref:BHLH domain-containing protein n=1 Tax=Knipowitschia caucasica TaxID=637954 RepID=A0AAV2M0E1_KNICA
MSESKSNHLQYMSPETMRMILSQSLCHDQGQGQGQTLAPEMPITEMSEAKYTPLQNLTQSHLDTQAEVINQGPGMSQDTLQAPLPPSQAIDLSTTSDGHEVVLAGEKTPNCYGEVPGFVLAKIRVEDTDGSNTCGFPSQIRGPSSARVCLEKRFNSLSGTLGHQDNPSAALSNFLSELQQSSETPDANSHLEKWKRCPKRSGLTEPYIGVFNPVCGPVISHMEQHQGLVFPKGLPINLCPERALTKEHITIGTYTSEDKHIPPPSPKRSDRAKPKSSGSRVAYRVVPLSQRRERHNSKERERRRSIRLCCDELNLLVPFCQTDTDKVTTLRWTAAYIRYINKMYGDVLKEEFQKMFGDKRGLQPNPSAVRELLLQETENQHLAVEP